MPVMVVHDEKAHQAERALREIERFMARPNNGLTPDQRQQLTQKKMRLRTALQRYKAARGHRATTTGLVAQTSIGNPAAAIVLLIGAALAAAGIAAVNSAQRTATIELDLSLEDVGEFMDELTTARGESPGQSVPNVDEMVIVTAGLALAVVVTVKDAEAEQTRVRRIDKKIEECLASNPERVEACRALLEAYRKAMRAYRIALNNLIRNAGALGRRHKLRRIREAHRVFIRALHDLVKCLGCTGIKFRKRKKGGGTKTETEGTGTK